MLGIFSTVTNNVNGHFLVVHGADIQVIVDLKDVTII
ncbi:hypothetical protein BW33_00896 [Pseudomonas sp. RIT288]|nr:hypothetical protein BW33_00896 [Pseudomonas sp. RIT288]